MRVKDIDAYEGGPGIFMKGTPLCPTCGKAPATIPAEPCPFDEELADYKDEKEILCECCDSCRHQCAMDI